MKPKHNEPKTAKRQNSVRMTSALTNLNTVILPEPRNSTPKKRDTSKSAPEPVAKTPKPDASPTKIDAKIDVGFGNALFIRGQGAGLSWDKGQPLACLDGITWRWTSASPAEPVEFKLLLNDQIWAAGENLKVQPGQELQIVPSFAA